MPLYYKRRAPSLPPRVPYAWLKSTIFPYSQGDYAPVTRTVPNASFSGTPRMQYIDGAGVVPNDVTVVATGEESSGLLFKNWRSVYITGTFSKNRNWCQQFVDSRVGNHPQVAVTDSTLTTNYPTWPAGSVALLNALVRTPAFTDSGGRAWADGALWSYQASNAFNGPVLGTDGTRYYNGSNGDGMPELMGGYAMRAIGFDNCQTVIMQDLNVTGSWMMEGIHTGGNANAKVYCLGVDLPLLRYRACGPDKPITSAQSTAGVKGTSIDGKGVSGQDHAGGDIIDPDSFTYFFIDDFRCQPGFQGFWSTTSLGNWDIRHLLIRDTHGYGFIGGFGTGTANLVECYCRPSWRFGSPGSTWVASPPSNSTLYNAASALVYSGSGTRSMYQCMDQAGGPNPPTTDKTDPARGNARYADYSAASTFTGDKRVWNLTDLEAAGLGPDWSTWPGISTTF